MVRMQSTTARYVAYLSGNNKNKGQIEVWNLHPKKRLWITMTKQDCPRVAEISPDGKTLAVGTIQGEVSFRELKTGKMIARTRCSEDVIRSLTFSPNGHVLAAAGDWGFQSDGIRLLDCSTHRLLAVLKVAFQNNTYLEKDWTLEHPDWFASLPDLSYIASDSVVKKIRNARKNAGCGGDPPLPAAQPGSVAALRQCYAR